MFDCVLPGLPPPPLTGKLTGRKLLRRGSDGGGGSRIETCDAGPDPALGIGGGGGVVPVPARVFGGRVVDDEM